MVLRRGPGTCKSFLQQPRRSTISNRQRDFSRKRWTFSGRAEEGERKWRKVRRGLIESWTLAWWQLRGGQALVGCFMGLFIKRFLFLWERGWLRRSWGRNGRRGGFEYLQISNKTSQEGICVFYSELYTRRNLLCSNNPFISWFGFRSLNGAWNNKSSPCLGFLRAATRLWSTWKKVFQLDRFGFKLVWTCNHWATLVGILVISDRRVLSHSEGIFLLGISVLLTSC